jgi:hypothetical protein
MAAARRAITPVAPLGSFVTVNATTIEASTVMAYTRPRARGEAALSRRPHSHRIASTDRSALPVHCGQEWVGTNVLVGVNIVEAVKRSCAIFDQRDRRVGRFDGCLEALRAVPSRGRAS